MSDIRHFEDFRPGEVIDHGTRRVTREEIIDFASQFDPQPFHLDEAAGAATMLGGLAASGWHTAAMLMRMMCDSFLNRSAGLGSPGITRLKWLRPVRAGDLLSGRSTVVETRASKSRPDMGIVTFRHEVLVGEAVVQTMDTPQIFRRRETAA